MKFETIQKGNVATSGLSFESFVLFLSFFRERVCVPQKWQCEGRVWVYNGMDLIDLIWLVPNKVAVNFI